jgi:SAM-dependent methyltransferase
MDRRAYLLSTLARSSHILELGPSHNPTAPKAAGWQTHVVDADTREGLIETYGRQGLDIGRIEAVDTVWRGGLLHEAVPAALAGSFDVIVASHVFEHLPNPIGFLASAQRLLKPGGHIALAIPDRRFCFDCFKPATTTGDLLEAFQLNRERHSARTAWNHEAYSVAADGRVSWGAGPIAGWQFMSSVAGAAAASRRAANTEGGWYQDYHAWHFTPASFELVMLELGEIGAVDWRIDDLVGTQGAEFFVMLHRGVTPARDVQALDTRRFALMRQVLIETQAQLTAMLTPPAGG